MISNEFWHCPLPGYWLARSGSLQTLTNTKGEEFFSPTSKFILMTRMTVALKEKRKKQVNKYRNNKSIIVRNYSVLCSALDLQLTVVGSIRIISNYTLPSLYLEVFCCQRLRLMWLVTVWQSYMSATGAMAGCLLQLSPQVSYMSQSPSVTSSSHLLCSEMKSPPDKAKPHFLLKIPKFWDIIHGNICFLQPLWN